MIFKNLSSIVWPQNILLLPSQFPVYKYSLLLLSIPLLSGCTPEQYRQSADAQVQKIIAERQRQTIDYPLATDLSEEPISTTPGRAAYAIIPATPIPPYDPPLIEPINDELTPGILGPEYPPVVPQFTTDDEELFGVTAERRQEAQRLRLGPDAPDTLTIELDLFQSLQYAVANSRDYRSRLEDLYLSALDVTLERHMFEPRPFVSTGLQYEGGGSRTLNFGGNVEYDSALSVVNRAGVRQRLPYGGEIVAEALVNFVDALQDNTSNGENATLALTGTLPLLRGAGFVNLEPLIQSERRVVYQIRQFENYRRELLVDVASRYFNLLVNQQRLINRQVNFVNLSALTRRTQALYEAGRINFQEVQRARQAQLSAETSLIDSQQDYQSALDTFKLVIGMDTDQPLAIVAVELDIKAPFIELDDVVELATSFRLDLQTARDQIEDAQRAVKVAENGLLPDLNLTAGISGGNFDDTSASSLEPDTTRYAAGITLDFPIDRLSERNIYRRSLIFLQRAQRSFVDLKERIAIAARDALRNIRSAELQLEIQRRGIELAQRRLDYANELLKEGLATSRDVVDAQQSLLEAQDRFASARSQLQISILRYLRDTGTLRLDPSAGALARAMYPVDNGS